VTVGGTAPSAGMVEANRAVPLPILVAREAHRRARARARRHPRKIEGWA